MVPGPIISRLVYEISADCNLDRRIYACAMMMYHAFMEYVSDDGLVYPKLHETDCVVLGVTTLVLSLKFNENYLNTIETASDVIKSRSMKVIESSARAIISYGGTRDLTTEQFVCVKEKLKFAVSELSVLRIFGNFATSIPIVPDTDSMDITQLISEYSTSQCLCRWSSSPHSS